MDTASQCVQPIVRYSPCKTLLRFARRCELFRSNFSMPTVSHLFAFCVAASLLILTPGPNFIYVLTRGTTQGCNAALLSAIGLGVGVLIHTTLACIGISALIQSSYLTFLILRYSGSLYLLFIGLKTLRRREIRASNLPQKSMTKTRILSQSIITSLTNPNTRLFFLSFLPQFVNHTTRNVGPQLFLLGIIYMLLTVLLYGTLAYFSGRIGQWLRARTVNASWLYRITGSSFIGLGIWAALPD